MPVSNRCGTVRSPEEQNCEVDTNESSRCSFCALVLVDDWIKAFLTSSPPRPWQIKMIGRSTFHPGDVENVVPQGKSRHSLSTPRLLLCQRNICRCIVSEHSHIWHLLMWKISKPVHTVPWLVHAPSEYSAMSCTVTMLKFAVSSHNAVVNIKRAQHLLDTVFILHAS